MPYKCEYNGASGCRNCKHTDIYGNSCPKCVETPCPLNEEDCTYPRHVDWCDQWCFEAFEPQKGVEIYNAKNANRNIIVVRPEDTVIVRVVLDRAGGLIRRWCFINLTKGHVGKCRFATYEDAIKDLEAQKESGKVLDWHYEGELK